MNKVNLVSQIDMSKENLLIILPIRLLSKNIIWENITFCVNGINMYYAAFKVHTINRTIFIIDKPIFKSVNSKDENEKKKMIIIKSIINYFSQKSL